MAKGRSNRHPRKKSSSRVLMLSILLMLTLVLFMLLGFGIFSIPIGYADDSLPIRHRMRLKRLTLESAQKTGEGVGESGQQWTEILSWQPRAFLYHNFLSKEECEHLINLSKSHMKKSKVVDIKTGKSVDSMVRTSSGTFLKRGQDEIIQRIEKRIADFTFIPAENGEGLQILHYEVGQKYDPHFDYFVDEINTKRGGQRIATVLMYLSDVEEGGETVFPVVGGNFNASLMMDDTIECAKRGISVKPKMGNALLFWSLRPDANLDTSSLHGACPVVKGNKWSATKWLHVDEYKMIKRHLPQ